MAQAKGYANPRMASRRWYGAGPPTNTRSNENAASTEKTASARSSIFDEYTGPKNITRPGGISR